VWARICSRCARWVGAAAHVVLFAFVVGLSIACVRARARVCLRAWRRVGWTCSRARLTYSAADVRRGRWGRCVVLRVHFGKLVHKGEPRQTCVEWTRYRLDVRPSSPQLSPLRFRFVSLDALACGMAGVGIVSLLPVRLRAGVGRRRCWGHYWCCSIGGRGWDCNRAPPFRCSSRISSRSPVKRVAR
jgi:hypothetical protein